MVHILSDRKNTHTLKEKLHKLKTNMENVVQQLSLTGYMCLDDESHSKHLRSILSVSSSRSLSPVLDTILKLMLAMESASTPHTEQLQMQKRIQVFPTCQGLRCGGCRSQAWHNDQLQSADQQRTAELRSSPPVQHTAATLSHTHTSFIERKLLSLRCNISLTCTLMALSKSSCFLIRASTLSRESPLSSLARKASRAAIQFSACSQSLLKSW